MSKKIIGKLPSIEELKSKYSLSEQAKRNFEQHEMELADIIS